MEFDNKKVGIWGLGIVGKTAIRYLHKQNGQLSAMDCRELNSEEQQFITKYSVSFYHENQIEKFFKEHDYIIVSPGINHPACQTYRHKIICELNLFASAYKKPIIAVTGSVGKTSVVHLLGHILKQRMNIGIGGNIGSGMLNLIEQQAQHNAALLELSSFQLAGIHLTNHQLNQYHMFAPDLAIWANFHLNHLDWHGSQESYFHAKQNIIRNQRPGQHALLPLSLLEKLLPLHNNDVNWYFMSVAPPSSQQREQINRSANGIFYVNEQSIVLEHNGNIHHLIKIQHLPPITFVENWITICAILHLLHIPLRVIQETKTQSSVPEHRLEKIATINGIDFYNDSKSTTPAATQAAVTTLSNRPIILLLGGISKGIDRAELIEHMDSSVKLIVCFGKERQQLASICHRYKKHCKSFQTLDEAFLYYKQIAQPGDQILLSPAGASFDQFENYKERGNQFKNLVHTLIPQKNIPSL